CEFRSQYFLFFRGLSGSPSHPPPRPGDPRPSARPRLKSACPATDTLGEGLYPPLCVSSHGRPSGADHQAGRPLSSCASTPGSLGQVQDHLLFLLTLRPAPCPAPAIPCASLRPWTLPSRNIS